MTKNGDLEDAVMKIRRDVMDSGYYFLLCQDVQAVWTACKPNSIENASLGVEKQVSSYTECQGDKKQTCHMRAEEIKCRN
mmetsp:Transcript_10219/g.12024  ORF Transcript_10219/g.12024 Transcript_10219/m.12024 type:complete len:80 (-) Transcript_10219:173-412(-)